MSKLSTPPGWRSMETRGSVCVCIALNNRAGARKSYDRMAPSRGASHEKCASARQTRSLRLKVQRFSAQFAGHIPNAKKRVDSVSGRVHTPRELLPDDLRLGELVDFIVRDGL